MNNYNCLDLNIVKEKIVELVSIEEARDYILNEQVSFNPLIIKQNSIETKEAMDILNKNINVQFAGIVNVNELLEKADKQITLDGNELKDILVLHNHSVRIKNIFDSIDEDINLKDYTDSINVSNNIFNKIEDCINNSGEIKEDASPLLKDINNKINILDKRLYSKAEQFINQHTSSLQEPSIYFRENRITFLVKNSDKKKYNGYTYGTSASGLACYVEPEVFVEMNNEMINLIHNKADEEIRILKELTYLVSTVSNDYRRNFECLTKLNVIFAKANYGIKYNCIIPEFIDSKYFEFNDLCHPLLDQNKVVSNTYRIYEPYQGIVISGSNTGGKTVSLKAIGLSIIMSYLGIPIIASKARIPLYRNVFVDIDDNQSIQDSLSTFSSHITNINYIVNNANENSLILIDELISGTDPKEAQAISLAILDKIKQIGSIFVITTHFDDIKNYSYEDEQILLSSVGFNTETLKPTYKYHENSIGSSNALEIASRYLDDKSLIDNARNYVVKNQTKQDQLLQKLSNEMEEVNNEKIKFKELRDKYEVLSDELNSKINEFEYEKKKLKEEYVNKLNEYINDIKQKAEEKLDSIKDSKDKDTISEIESLSSPIISNEKIEFKIGDNVRINENEQIGSIIDINGDKATINLHGITIKTSINDLTLMPKIENRKRFIERPRMASCPKEINLVGQRVEDGLVLMEEYLDRANGAKLSSVKVIHGIGTGALRTALRQRMKKLSYIKSFTDGDFYDGGSAVTIVEFK